MTKKKILIFIDWFLPGERAGGPVRSCINLVENLGDEFEFSVVTRNTDYTSDVVYPGVKSDDWNVLGNGMRVYYFSQTNLTRSGIGKLIDSELPDVIYLNGMWSEPFTQWPLKCIGKKGTKVILAVRGMLAPSAMAIKSLKKKTFLSIAKFRGLYSNVIFHATNDREAGEVKQYFGNAVVRVAANLPRKNERTDAGSPQKKAGSLHVINVSRFAPEKNNLFALEVLSKCKNSVEADFFGSVYNKEYYSKCESALQAMPFNVKVTLHDAVASEKIVETLKMYDVMFLPSRGENFGHIILEAMQAGIPVLISDRTPWKQLEVSGAGWDLPLNSAETFSKKLDELAAMDERSFSRFRKGALQKANSFLEESRALEMNRKLFD